MRTTRSKKSEWRSANFTVLRGSATTDLTISLGNNPKNSTSFTSPFLIGRGTWAGHETDRGITPQHYSLLILSPPHYEVWNVLRTITVNSIGTGKFAMIKLMRFGYFSAGKGNMCLN